MAVKKTAKKAAKVKKTAKAKSVVKKVTKKAAAPAKKVVSKRVASKKVVAKKTPAKSAVSKKVASKPVASKKKAPIKKAVSKKAPVKKMVQLEPITAKTGGGFLGFNPYQIGSDEEYMSDKHTAHFRDILLGWKEQLMAEVDSTVIHMKEDAASYPDPLDRASQEEGFSLELRTRDRERKLLKKIEQSLDALESGDYGFCEDCGAEIGVRRLEARPTAEKCIDCKTFQEIREKQIGG